MIIAKNVFEQFTLKPHGIVSSQPGNCDQSLVLLEIDVPGMCDQSLVLLEFGIPGNCDQSAITILKIIMWELKRLWDIILLSCVLQ